MESEVRDETIEDLEEEQEFADLQKLKVSAPDDSLTRLNKRVRTAQVGKDLVEKQAFAFWTVIDAFLKLIFGTRKDTKVEIEKQEKDNGRNLSNGI